MGLGDYMHQQSLMDAYKKLYMLGHRSHSKSHEQLDENISSAGGGISKAYQDKLSRDKAAMATLQRQSSDRKRQEEVDANQQKEDVRYIKEGPEAFHQWQQVVAGNAVPENPYKDELAKQAVDKEAEQARIGGIYTPQGLQQADKESTANANDRLMLRSLVTPPGLGGSAPIGPMPGQPPNQMQNYRVR